MLKTNNEAARSVFRSFRKNDKVADEYITFIHRLFPAEEASQYTVSELRTVATALGIKSAGLSASSLLDEIRQNPQYMQYIRDLLSQ